MADNPQSPVDYRRPPHLRDHIDALRGVGVEIEFAGLSIQQVTEIVVDLYGGRVERESAFVVHVLGAAFGDFTIEFDSRLLKDARYREMLTDFGLDPDSQVVDWVGRAIEATAGTVVPTEVVTPPIPVTELHALDPLVERLRTASARGTGKSLFYAFGLHLNPSVPSLSVGSLLRHLQAFLLLESQIATAEGIDLSRRLTPFIHPFPRGYRRRVLDPAYDPTIEVLIDDYLEANATRNRPLDMLPVFAHIDFDRVAPRVEEPELLSARPTFHYRMPDCRIDDPSWSVAVAWNHWVDVEELADADEKLASRLRQRAARRMTS